MVSRAFVNAVTIHHPYLSQQNHQSLENRPHPPATTQKPMKNGEIERPPAREHVPIASHPHLLLVPQKTWQTSTHVRLPHPSSVLFTHLLPLPLRPSIRSDRDLVGRVDGHCSSSRVSLSRWKTTTTLGGSLGERWTKFVLLATLAKKHKTHMHAAASSEGKLARGISFMPLHLHMHPCTPLHMLEMERDRAGFPLMLQPVLLIW